MNVWYLHNSGFAVEAGGRAFVIDWYQGGVANAAGGAREWKIPLPQAPSDYKGVYVLASHAHGDHYSPEIFAWRKDCADIEYVLSYDIQPVAQRYARGGGGDGGADGGAGGAGGAGGSTGGGGSAGGGAAHVTWLSPDRKAMFPGLVVRAFGSTDQGVSFQIDVASGGGGLQEDEKDIAIFHAGDLNYWHWMDESTPEEVAEQRGYFERELARIREHVKRIDVAFFPVDPRLGTDYWRGAAMFCEAMQPKVLIPMHFQDRPVPPEDFLEAVQAGGATRVLLLNDDTPTAQITI